MQRPWIWKSLAILFAPALLAAQDEPVATELADDGPVSAIVAVVAVDDEGASAREIIIDGDEETDKAIRLRLGVGGAITIDEDDEGETSTRYWIGLDCVPADDVLRAQLGLEAPLGLTIRNVVDDSPAEQAGLKANDVIVGAEVGDEEYKVTGISQLGELIQDAQGQPVTLSIIRGGKHASATVKPARQASVRLVKQEATDDDDDDDDGDGDDDDDKRGARRKGDRGKKAPGKIKMKSDKGPKSAHRHEHAGARRHAAALPDGHDGSGQARCPHCGMPLQGHGGGGHFGMQGHGGFGMQGRGAGGMMGSGMQMRHGMQMGGGMHGGGGMSSRISDRVAGSRPTGSGGRSFYNSGTIHFHIGPFVFGDGHHVGGAAGGGPHRVGAPQGGGPRTGGGPPFQLHRPGGPGGMIHRGGPTPPGVGQRLESFVKRLEGTRGGRPQGEPQGAGDTIQQLRDKLQQLQQQQQQMAEALQQIAKSLEDLQQK